MKALNDIINVNNLDGEALYNHLYNAIENNNYIIAYHLLIVFIKTITIDANSLYVILVN